ncbi:MAG: cytochrome c maturation protein CcmE [Actinobacteria bacterium]|nr:cytochrome c maturation protein CcmE [Actinomycetota bacterium]
MRRYARFVIPALGLVAVLLGFLLFNLKDSLVFFRTPTEVVQEAQAGDGDRMRLGGQVVAGTIDETTDGVAFDVSDGTTTIAVIHTGAPQQLFQEGIGVVITGTWDGTMFHSDEMMVKHDEQYRTEDGGEYHPGDYPDSATG